MLPIIVNPRPSLSSHFGIANIPFGIASSASHPHPACATRIKDDVIFLDKLESAFTNLPDLPVGVFAETTLNTFAALPNAVHQGVRNRLQAILSKPLSDLLSGTVVDASAATMHLPVQVGDFTDFSCSYHHVQNASEAMSGKRSAPPAFFHMPVGYAGRCSSLDISGTPVERPMGQYWEGKPGESKVVFGPCKKMDYELELGCIIGKPLARRVRTTASKASEHIFGFVLINDWSARDIQGLEMIPLGPLNGKNAATTISPWIVTVEALKPFRIASPSRKQDLVPYLAESGEEALNIHMQVHIVGPNSEKAAGEMTCESNTSYMYWTLEQCVAHQAIGGCGLRTGDLVATGTVTGPGANEHGCLLEYMRIGEQPPRGYLEDGETVILTGFCGDGVGFGECTATLTPANARI